MDIEGLIEGKPRRGARRDRRLPAALAALGTAVALLAACTEPTATPAGSGPTPTPSAPAAGMNLKTEAFQSDGTIPRRHTCDGDNVSPALTWDRVPSGVQSFALIMDDPDAPRGTFTHWVLFDIPSGTRSIPEGAPQTDRLDGGAAQGKNGAGRTGYTGPCPPAGSPHHYRFHLYALDRTLGLAPGATKEDVLNALQGHTIAETELVGLYTRAS